MSKSPRKKRRRHFQRRTAPGAPPGVVAVDPASRPPVVHVMAYDAGRCADEFVTHPDEIRRFLDEYAVTWVNVEGLGDASIIQGLGQVFGLHPLALEDVVNTHQRAKVEQYVDHLFLVARMGTMNDRLETEQVSLFLGQKFVVTFVEDPGDSFDPVRARLKTGRARVSSAGPGYLAYALLDAVVDAYFPIVEVLGDRLDDLELAVTDHPDRPVVGRIHAVKHDLRTLRRVVWPLREAISALARDDSELVDAETRVYLRDCYDHVVQIMDLVETYRELCSDLTDLYLSSLSNRMNEVMKVLTIISTIFIPLSFVAGVYGMNFDPDTSPWNMPELRWYWGYPMALSMMGAILLALLAFFYRKGWLAAMAAPSPSAQARQAQIAHALPRNPPPAEVGKPLPLPESSRPTHE